MNVVVKPKSANMDSKRCYYTTIVSTNYHRSTVSFCICTKLINPVQLLQSNLVKPNTKDQLFIYSLKLRKYHKLVTFFDLAFTCFPLYVSQRGRALTKSLENLRTRIAHMISSYDLTHNFLCSGHQLNLIVMITDTAFSTWTHQHLTQDPEKRSESAAVFVKMRDSGENPCSIRFSQQHRE